MDSVQDLKGSILFKLKSLNTDELQKASSIHMRSDPLKQTLEESKISIAVVAQSILLHQEIYRDLLDLMSAELCKRPTMQQAMDTLTEAFPILTSENQINQDSVFENENLKSMLTAKAHKEMKQFEDFESRSKESNRRLRNEEGVLDRDYVQSLTTQKAEECMFQIEVLNRRVN